MELQNLKFCVKVCYKNTESIHRNKYPVHGSVINMGIINFIREIQLYCRSELCDMLNRIATVQVCDATGHGSSNEAGKQIKKEARTL